MDLRKLKTLIDLVSESDIAELEVTEGDSKVRIAKAPPPSEMSPMMISAPQHAQQLVQIPAASAAPAVDVSASAATEEAGTVVKSPMVGTFYAAPSPGKPNFVSVGDSVSVGQTLCIVEAMKLLNEIDAETTGVIKKVMVENGQPVEYGQPLFLIG